MAQANTYSLNFKSPRLATGAFFGLHGGGKKMQRISHW